MTKIIYTAALASVLVLSLMTSNGLAGTNYTANAFSDRDDKPHPFNHGNDDHSKKNNICPSQSFLVGPGGHGATKILDITFVAQNDEDSGVGTYWALDHMTEHLKVWQLPDASYYALKTYGGIFVAPTGGLDPAGLSIHQTESAVGDITGGYVATFTATSFNPNSLPASGNIGTFNFHGTMSDILAGIQGPQLTPYDWSGQYFGGFNNFVQTHWGWSYKLDSELQSSTSANQWCNYDSGNSGDMLT